MAGQAGCEAAGPGGVPDAASLARHAEEWLRLLRAALPREEAPEGGLPGRPAVEGRGPAGGQGPLCQPGAGAGAAAKPRSTAAEQPQAPGREEEASSLLALSLDRFFGDPRAYERVAEEVAGTRQREAERTQDAGSAGASTFRVQVPKQYPGVQYRKSKNLTDRYSRYAKSGTVVTGHVEDGGEWLRISDQVFLPMKVGGMQILEPAPRDAAVDVKAESSSTLKSLWFACSQGNHGEEQEVVTDLKETS
mmetsp:Transcript_61478/g.197905  ORF Transcript_61478/g.197905 Transcript_61478/m.197905 type:complete len:249 (-) Transcript_61478:90-836(-)